MRKLLLIILLSFTLTLSGCTRLDSDDIYRSIVEVENIELLTTILNFEIKIISPTESYATATFYQYCEEYDYTFKTETIYVHQISGERILIDKEIYDRIEGIQ